MPKSRREFFKKSIALGSAFAIPASIMAGDGEPSNLPGAALELAKYTSSKALDLSPAAQIFKTVFNAFP